MGPAASVIVWLTWMIGGEPDNATNSAPTLPATCSIGSRYQLNEGNLKRSVSAKTET
jgi:hypothetical protein